MYVVRAIISRVMPRVYADLNALYEKIRQERKRALKEFQADVVSGQYPGEAEIVHANEGEVEQFREYLEESSEV